MINGSKRIEIRLFDEKRRIIKIGDTIKFLKEPELEESFEVKVVDLLRYDSFEDMFNASSSKNIFTGLIFCREDMANIIKEQLKNIRGF